jgi:hypothetical protein
MSENDPTKTKLSMTAVGEAACGRARTNMARLDKAINAKVAELKSSDKAEDKATLVAYEAKKAEQAVGHLGKAQTNSQDHEDNKKEFESLVEAGKNAEGGKPGLSKIDQQIKAKYSDPLEEKMELARILKIGMVGSEPIEQFEEHAKQNIGLIRDTATLVANGKTELEIPNKFSAPDDRNDNTRFAGAITSAADAVRDGKKEIPFLPPKPGEEMDMGEEPEAEATTAGNPSCTDNVKHRRSFRGTGPFELGGGGSSKTLTKGRGNGYQSRSILTPQL